MSLNVKLLSTLLVILLVDKKNELPADIKNEELTLDAPTTVSFTGVVDIFVILAYSKLLVINCPAPGVSLNVNIGVLEPEGQLSIRLSI
jgi:hypothetical protein